MGERAKKRRKQIQDLREHREILIEKIFSRIKSKKRTDKRYIKALRYQMRKTVQKMHELGLKFACECGRFQPWAHRHRGGGVTVLEAEAFGWVRVDKKWICPFCSGNTGQLEQIFRRH